MQKGTITSFQVVTQIMFQWDKGKASFYRESFCPGSQLGWFNVNEVSKLWSSDRLGQGSVHW